MLPDGEELEATTSRDERERLIRETVDSCDTVLFGATSGKTGGIGYLRWGKETFANVRPIRWRPGYQSPLREPGGIDYVIVRENLEDLYLGLEGDLATLLESNLPAESRFGAQSSPPQFWWSGSRSPPRLGSSISTRSLACMRIGASSRCLSQSAWIWARA